MGGAITSLQKVWINMRYRCRNPNCAQYKDYGGRGITICPDWETFKAFETWAKENGYRGGLILDRINNDLGYSPENCRFTTAKTSQNNRRSLRPVSAFGETKNVTQWSEDERCVVARHTLYQRLDRGWSPERAMTKPT